MDLVQVLMKKLKRETSSDSELLKYYEEPDKYNIDCFKKSLFVNN